MFPFRRSHAPYTNNLTPSITALMESINGLYKPNAFARPCTTKARTARSPRSNTRPPAGLTGTTIVGFTRASATSHQPSLSKPTTRPTTESRNPYRSGGKPAALQTDNGACYRSRDFAAALGEIRHVFTRPYRSQTNGKVERFNRTLAQEWAYAHTYLSDEARAAT